MSLQSARDCHPSGLPGHGDFVIAVSGTEVTRFPNRDYADARQLAQDHSVMGPAVSFMHEHRDGTRCLVATYQHGSEAHGGGI